MHQDELLFTEFFNQKLKERGLTLKQLSDQTGIPIKHLENFGNGRFERLPPAPYLHGYFVKLGSIMDFNPDEWWRRIKEDDGVHASGPQDRMPGNRYSRTRGRILAAVAVIAVLAAIYVAARFTTIIGEPQITLTGPSATENRVFQDTVTFQGVVRNGDTLTIDGTNVPLASDGSFSADVPLDPDKINTIELVAKKTLGREATLTRQIYYDTMQISAPQAIIPAP
jgi:cytoskeletal protein RodZ